MKLAGFSWGKFELHIITPCLFELIADEYFREKSNQFLDLINIYLLSSYLEKVFKEKRHEDRKESSRELLEAGDPRKETGK